MMCMREWDSGRVLLKKMILLDNGKIMFNSIYLRNWGYE